MNTLPSSDILKKNLPTEEQLAQLSFHIKTGDFFATMATVLGFLEETVYKAERDKSMESIQIQTIEQLKKQLLYLQQNYSIVPKDGE